MSLVHFVFPNVSMAGLAGRPLMVSRLLPGPDARSVDGPSSTTTSASPSTATDDIARPRSGACCTHGGARRGLLDGFASPAALDAVGDDHFRFGRNEAGNQHVHRWIDQLVGAGAGSA